MLTVADAEAIEREAPSVGKVDVWLGAWGAGTRERAYYQGEKTKQLAIIGVSENYAAVNFMKIAGGRFFTATEVEHRRNLAVLGDTPVKALFPNVDPVGKTIRIAGDQYEVVGVLRPAAERRRPGQRPGRLHRHPVHDLPEAVRVAPADRQHPRGRDTDQRQRVQERDDRRRARRGGDARRRDEGSRADHARSAMA